MMTYKGIRFDDHSHSKDSEYDYNWSQICTACACEHGIYAEAAKNDCPATLICGVEGCDNEADFYIDFDGSEQTESEEQPRKNVWGRLGMTAELTELEFDILQCGGEAACALVRGLVKSGRFRLSGETYFPEASGDDVHEFSDEICLEL